MHEHTQRPEKRVRSKSPIAEPVAKILRAYTTDISIRNFEILTDSLFMSDRECGEAHNICSQRVSQIRKRYHELWIYLLERKDEIISALAQDTSYHITKKLRTWSQSEKLQTKAVGCVKDAALLAQTVTQTQKVARSAAPAKDDPDPTTQKQTEGSALGALQAMATPTTSCSSPPEKDISPSGLTDNSEKP